MILIADSGSTKTDWCVVLNGAVIKRLGTKGINPFFQSEEEIQQKLTASLLPQLPEGKFNAVYFYGAGCTPEKAPVLRRAIADSLPVIGNIKANSDMLVGDILKNQLPATLKEEFLKQFDLTPPEIIDRVYRQPFPNRFLASLSPFIAQHLEEPAIRQLVMNSFIAFFRRNVMQYDYKQYTVHFIGSIAYCYKEILQDAARQTGIQIGKILQSPMEGLIQYHSQLSFHP